MLPDGNPSFERFFGSLRLVESPPLSGAGSFFELAPVSFFSDGERLGAAEPLLATYDDDSTAGLTPESAIRRLAKELASVGHLADASVARAFLALYALTDRPNGTAVSRLNDLVRSICEAEVAEYLIAPFPAFPGLQRFVIEDFQI